MQEENQKAIDNALFKKLEQLAIKMPNDPMLYKEDVEKYTEMFKIQFQKLQGETMRRNQRFGQLLIFLSKSVKFFPKQLGFLPTTIMNLMNELGRLLHSYNRKKCIACIMILRAKNIILPIQTIEFLLKQFNLEDKELRKILYKYILNDIRRMNKHHKNNAINQQLKKFISQYISKNSDKTAQKSLQLMIELHKRNIWNDTRTVNIIAEGCFNASVKIKLISSHFLITTTQHLEQLSQSQDDLPNPSDITFKKGIIKHTKNKDKQVQKQKKRAARRLRKRQIAGRKQNFMPIDLIYSPQDFAEKLFNIMNQKQTKFVHKLVYMSLIARIIWRHKLIILPFYGALQKYMDPRQAQVHRVLTYFAESVHQLVPDDELETIMKHIIQTFVNDKCSQFAMTIGLNTIRQVYSKVCSIITQDAMTYLCTYYEYKNKNVSRAAKSVINLVREINPYLLQKKFRGKFNEQALDLSNKNKVSQRIDGADLLQEDMNSLPVEMDRVFTDQDFKRIRKLAKKREQDENWGQIQEEQGQNQEQGQNSQGELDWDNVQDVQEGDQQNEQDSQEDEEIQIDDGQFKDLIQGEDEEEQIDGQQQNQDEEEDESEEISEEDDSQGELEFQDQQEVKQESKLQKAQAKTKQISKKEKSKKQLYDSDSEQQSSEDQNPHGFINIGQISFYKKSKTQIKADKKRNPEQPKFKHTPKQKKGGTTNEEKKKQKPILMLRNKKNKLKSRQKQVKLRIKNLKNQLGKVRSGKQAKKLKNKKIVKKV